MSIIVALISTRDGLVASDGRHFGSASLAENGKVIQRAVITSEEFDKTFSLNGGKLIGAFTGLMSFSEKTIGQHILEIIENSDNSTVEKNKFSTITARIEQRMKTKLGQIDNREVIFACRKLDILLVGSENLTGYKLRIAAISFFPDNGSIVSKTKIVLSAKQFNQYYIYGEEKARTAATEVFRSNSAPNRDSKFLTNLAIHAVDTGIRAAGIHPYGLKPACGGKVFTKRFGRNEPPPPDPVLELRDDLNQLHRMQPGTNILVNAKRDVTIKLLDDGSIMLSESDKDVTQIQIVNARDRKNPQKPIKPYLKYYVDVGRPFKGDDSDFNHLDAMFAVDTNYRIVDESNDIKMCVGVSGTVQLKQSKQYQGEAIFVHGHSFVFFTRHPNPELVSLHWIIYDIIERKKYSPSAQIGIVLDTEFTKQDLFNNRDIPYVGQHYLPPNFEIIYAASDSGGKHLANKMIKICDKGCKQGFGTLTNEDIACKQLLGDKLFHIHKAIVWNANAIQRLRRNSNNPEASR